MNPSPILDSAAYPHIYERVVAYAPYEALVQLRLVNRASRRAANAILFDHIAIGLGEPITDIDERPQFVALSVSASSHTPRRRCFLPVPPFSASAPPVHHDGWKHTRVLDIEAPNLRRIPALSTMLPELEMMRRRQAHPPSLPARTMVDLIQLPMWDRDNDRYVGSLRPISRAHPSVKRHVIIVCYDPSEDLFTPNLACPFWNVDVPCVVVFRALGSATGAMDLAEYVRTPRAETFLDFFFKLVADRTHVSYTLVGLEEVPPSVLAPVLGIDPRSSAECHSWAQLVRDCTIEALRATPTDSTEFLEDDPDYHPDIADVVEVLTMGEYRDRVGEEIWELETFGDKLPELSMS